MGRFEKFVKSWLPIPLFIVLAVVLLFTPAFSSVRAVLGDLTFLMCSVAFLLGCLVGLIYRKLGPEIILGIIAFLLVCLFTWLPSLMLLTLMFFPPTLICIIALLIALLTMAIREESKEEKR